MSAETAIDEYLTPNQIAAQLQLNVETVYRWLRAGKLPGLRVSRKSWRIDRKQFEDFMKGCSNQ